MTKLIKHKNSFRYITSLNGQSIGFALCKKLPRKIIENAFYLSDIPTIKLEDPNPIRKISMQYKNDGMYYFLDDPIIEIIRKGKNIPRFRYVIAYLLSSEEVIGYYDVSFSYFSKRGIKLEEDNIFTMNFESPFISLT